MQKSSNANLYPTPNIRIIFGAAELSYAIIAKELVDMCYNGKQPKKANNNQQRDYFSGEMVRITKASRSQN